MYMFSHPFTVKNIIFAQIQLAKKSVPKIKGDIQCQNSKIKQKRYGHDSKEKKTKRQAKEQRMINTNPHSLKKGGLK